MKSLKAGDKVYWNQKDKSVILAVIGKEPVHEGIKIVGSHIDSPRLDLKANPVHEQDGIVYFRTHYYGGIKKYQWTCIPLALIGVVFTKTVKSGYQYRTERQRPRFYVSDLLIHMAQDQMKKTLAEGITGEQLQAVAGTHSEEGQTPKDAIMALLKKNTGSKRKTSPPLNWNLFPPQRAATSDLTGPSSLLTGRTTAYVPTRIWKPSWTQNPV